MKNLRMLLLSCALLTISSQTPFFLSAITPNITSEESNLIEKSRLIIAKAENIIPSLIEKDQSTKKKGSMDLLNLFEKPNITNIFGLKSEHKLKFVQTLASLIDANNIILKVLSIGDIDQAVIVRLIEYIKIGMPDKLNDFVSKTLVMAALFYQPQVIKVLLNNYNPNLDFVYANKKAYQALLARKELCNDENHLFKEILLQLMTGSHFGDSFFTLKSTDEIRAYYLTKIFIEEKFDKEFNAIYSLFEYLYAATKNSGSEHDIVNLDDEIEYQRAIMNNTQFEKNYVKKISDLLSPEQCIRIIQKFLNNGLEDYALSLLNNVVDTSTEDEDITIDKGDFIKKLMILMPSMTQYKQGTTFYTPAQNILKNSIEKIYALNTQEIQQKAKTQYQEIQQKTKTQYDENKKKEAYKLKIDNLYLRILNYIRGSRFNQLLEFLQDQSPALLVDLFQYRRFDSYYHGKTLLHFMVEEHNVWDSADLEECWDIILALPNLDLNIQDDTGDTPLHLASMLSRHPMSDIGKGKLKKAGARTDIKNDFGLTPDELTNFDDQNTPLDEK